MIGMTKRIYLVLTVSLLLIICYAIQNIRDINGLFNNQSQKILKELTSAYKSMHDFPDQHNDTVIIPSKDELSRMSHEALGDLYHMYVTSLQYFCRRITRLGKLADGGWNFCDDYIVRPRKDCLVYSYGINNDFSFDDHVVRKYNCEVHSFDPTMKVQDHQHGRNVFFHATGLSNNNDRSPKNWKMRTLDRQRTELNHSNRMLDMLKVDIESYEWLVFPQMIAAGSLKNIRQFAVEIHIKPTKERYLTILCLLKDLYDAGLRIFWANRNLHCRRSFSNVERTGCHEISFININNL